MSGLISTLAGLSNVFVTHDYKPEWKLCDGNFTQLLFLVLLILLYGMLNITRLKVSVKIVADFTLFCASGH